MSDDIAVPEQPPLEIIKQGRVWVLEAFEHGTRVGETFATHDSQIDAVRAAKTKMETGRHPCTLRWDSQYSVGNLYWNPLFECLEVRYDELLEAWSVVPEQGTTAMATQQSRQAACERAKQLQREYYFKHLRAYDADADQFEERDHRFLRYDITRSGVRFDPEVVAQRAQSDETEPQQTDTQAEATTTYTGPATPGQLGASIPDVTQVQFVDTDGCLHRYSTPWGDGTHAEILALSRKYTDESTVHQAFETWLSRWRNAANLPAVAPIYEYGSEPARWVAYQASEHTLASIGGEVPVDDRIEMIEQISAAVSEMATTSADPVCGLHPERVHVYPIGSDWRVTISTWGLEWAVQQATGTHTVSAFTAPEQLDGHLTERTSVYQCGALTYWLLCESAPVPEVKTVEAIKAGEIVSPEPIAAVSSDVSPVIEQALAMNPDDRYASAEQFCQALQDRL